MQKEDSYFSSAIDETKEGVILSVKIIPKSSQNKIIFNENQFLKIRIKAIPEKGKANRELIKFLSKTFKIPQREISIVSGETYSQKRVLIKDLSFFACTKILQEILL